MKISRIERFLRRVDIKGPDQCWEYLGGRNYKGYGWFRFSMQKVMGAHRASYILHNGEIEEGLHVLHKCDNPGCVNPNHLFIGTNQDNVDDKMLKGRSPIQKGVANSKAKLNERQVKGIRELRTSTGMSYGKIANLYGVTKSCIMSLVKRKTWSDVA